MKKSFNGDELLHWLWCSTLQVKRFAKSFEKNIKLSSSVLTNGDLTVKQRKIYSQSSWDCHALLIALNNFRKAYNLLDANRPILDKNIFDDITILRNCLEHWESTKIMFENAVNKKEQSALLYFNKHPDKTPFSISWSNQRGLVIGGILNVSNLLIELKKAETVILQNKFTKCLA